MASHAVLPWIKLAGGGRILRRHFFTQHLFSSFLFADLGGMCGERSEEGERRLSFSNRVEGEEK